MEKKIIVTIACPAHTDEAKAAIEKAVEKGEADGGLILRTQEDCVEKNGTGRPGYSEAYARGWDAFMRRRTDVKQ